MIRLIETCDLSLHEFEGRSVPPYAILSHRWEDGEITLQELQGHLNQHKPGWQKVRQFCRYAKQKGHQYVWIDTCNIDKTSSAELSEAINSMFNWYRRAERCYAYLYDVPATNDSRFRRLSERIEVFKRSEWWGRSWTLQELLAPRQLTFVCQNWEQDIGTRQSLCQEISEATKIPKRFLDHGWSLMNEFGGIRSSVAEIMSWASERRAARVEDTAYSLMGLFRINMPLLYGEGLNSFIRLQLEIMSKYDDNSLFTWKVPPSSHNRGTTQAMNRSLDLPDDYTWGGLLAPVIQCFQGCEGHVIHPTNSEAGRLFSMTNRGIQVEGLLRKYEGGFQLEGGRRWLLPLNCGNEAWTRRLGVVLARHGQLAFRIVDSQGFDSDLVECDYETELDSTAKYEHAKIFVPQVWPGDFD